MTDDSSANLLSASGLSVQEIVQKPAVLCAYDGRELLLCATRELLQIWHAVHELTVVVRVHPGELAQKVLRRHVERLLVGRSVGGADGRGRVRVGFGLGPLECLEDGDGVGGRARPEAELGEVEDEQRKRRAAARSPSQAPSGDRTGALVALDESAGRL